MINYKRRYVWVGKKGSSHGVITFHKIGNCNECIENALCDNCDELVNQTKEFPTILIELKRKAPNVFNNMLPWYKSIYMW